MTEVTEINVLILKLLADESENMTPGQIIRKLKQFSKKDVKYSIRRLREKGLIKVIPNLMDMRRVFYR
ncbi:MAG: winged helix DNA-binding protein, partial [Candidatus Kariarchaeaceae archaeon]